MLALSVVARFSSLTTHPVSDAPPPSPAFGGIASALGAGLRPRRDSTAGLPGPLASLSGIAIFLAAALFAGLVAAQEPLTPAPTKDADRQAAVDPDRMAEEALAAEDPQQESSARVSAAAVAEKLDWLDLLTRGGILMWPIAATSLLVVTFGLERLLGLRRRKVVPPRLMHELQLLARHPAGLDPRQVQRLCHLFPSSASNVIRAMLFKVGRPQIEIEGAAEEASNREAARLYSNVRWLNLAAAVAPLLGLLGTVQGMIQSFFVTANLPPGANKADMLAEGIYIALVTTLAGLSVAIPATVLAHFFEGRIQALFRDLDETLLGLMPQLERFEGRLRARDQAPAESSPPPVNLGITSATGRSK